MADHRFSDPEIAAVYRAIAERRDMRHFRPDPVDPALLQRLLWAAHHAPSVGFMQPWRFIRVTDRALREAMHALVETERQATAQALGERQDDFMRLKVEGLLEAGESQHVQILAAFDHEEIGSETRSGASGPFLESVLRRIAGSLGWTDDDLARAFAQSFVVSADAGHALHPNYPQLHDPDHRPLPNAGPLIKFNANQRYATDAVGEAAWRRACAVAGVPTQDFVSNNAVPCGSTVGPFVASDIGAESVDVGVPLLSMHSTRELAGVQDPGWLAAALSAYYAGA